MTRRNAVDQVIEYPSAGATYCREQYGVYEYSTYARSSVLAGQERRVFLDSYETLADAQAAFPRARVGNGCGYVAPSLHHLSDSEG